MLNNETNYWREKYKENPSDHMFDDCCGEILALLDPKNDGLLPGTTKLFSNVLLTFAFIMFLFFVILVLRM